MILPALNNVSRSCSLSWAMAGPAKSALHRVCSCARPAPLDVSSIFTWAAIGGMRFALDHTHFLKRRDGGPHRLRFHAFRARQVGSCCRPLLREARAMTAASVKESSCEAAAARTRRTNTPNGLSKVNDGDFERLSWHDNSIIYEIQLSLQGKLTSLAGYIWRDYRNATCRRLGWRSQVIRRVLSRPEIRVPEIVLDRS